MSILQDIESLRSKLRKSEQKVADYVLTQAQQVIHMRIVDLAQSAGVSEPTVIRFCRAAEFNGFQNFKLALAQELASQGEGPVEDVTALDTIADSAKKVFGATIDQLIRARDSLDYVALSKTVNVLCEANRVQFFGFGASAAVAADATHKFFRLQISTAAYADPHLQQMAASSSKPGDAVVAISHSGRTKDLLGSIETVKINGGTVIALAPMNTPVAEAADIVIPVRPEEDTRLFAPVTLRIAQLVIIDLLAIAVAQRREPELKEHLHRLNLDLERLRV